LRKKRNACRILVGNLRGSDHLENLVLDGRIILKWILTEMDGKAWTR
jgi:small nuclear ribonucleoprotein (snRNP)-like protein